MRRFFLIIFCFGLALFTGVSLLRTNAGAKLSISLVERIVSMRSDLRIRCKHVSGDIFSDLSVQELMVKPPEGDEIRLKGVHLAWSLRDLWNQDSVLRSLFNASLSIEEVRYQGSVWSLQHERSVDAMTYTFVTPEGLPEIQLRAFGSGGRFLELTSTHSFDDEIGLRVAKAIAEVSMSDSEVLPFLLSLKVNLENQHALAVDLETSTYFDLDGHLNGNMTVLGDLEQLGQLARLTEHLCQGQVQGTVDFEGAASKPLLRGSIEVSGISYEHLVLGTQVESGDCRLLFDGSELRLEAQAQARTGGTLVIDGAVDWAKMWDPLLNLNLELAHFDLIKRSDVQTQVSGDLHASGKLHDLLVQGTVIANSVELTEPNLPPSSIPELTIQSEDGDSVETVVLPDFVHLNVDIEFPEKVFLRGRGVDAELKGHVEIRGSANQPMISGNLETIRGSYDFLGQRFDVKEGGLTFFGADVLLELIAEARMQSMTAIVSMRSTMDRVELNLSSDPAYPEEEIVSQLLFGMAPEKLNVMQAAKLAMAVQQLRGKGGSGWDLMGAARRLLGLDYLSVGASSDHGPTVEAGAYVLDGVYLGLDAGLLDARVGSKLRIELSPELSLEAWKPGDESASSLSLSWKHDY